MERVSVVIISGDRRFTVDGDVDVRHVPQQLGAGSYLLPDFDLVQLSLRSFRVGIAEKTLGELAGFLWHGLKKLIPTSFSSKSRKRMKQEEPYLPPFSVLK